MTTTTVAANNPQSPAPLNQNQPQTQAEWQQILNQLSSWQSTLAILVPPIQQTDAERSAGVTPVNYAYPPGYVDRYATNTTPGTTDMSAAFTAAIKSAYMGSASGPPGCKVRWGATAPYRLSNPVDATGVRGIIFEDEAGDNQAAAFASIIVSHTGHGFDCSTSNELTFNNVVATSLSGIVPKTLFFCARNAAGSGSGIHRFNNCRTASACTFNFIYYGYASEENNFTGCEWYNSQPGSAVVSCNGTNPANYTSTFASIASGSQSNADHRFWGCSFFNLGNSGSHNEVCVQIENALNFRMRDGLLACQFGISYVTILGNTASNFLTFDSVRGEALGNPSFGYHVTPSAGSITHVAWTFNNCNFNGSGGALLNFLNTNGPAIQNLAMRACTATSGVVLNAYNMSASIVETMQDSVVTGQAGGTVTGNLFIGGRNNITLSGTFSGNTYLDNFTGTVGIDGDTFSSSPTACTGALTANYAWTLFMGPNKSITLKLPSLIATIAAGAHNSFTAGAALPVAYRPPADSQFPVFIGDNGTQPAQVGMVIITASTGVITVFKDPTAGTNFTAATNGGLLRDTYLQWHV